MDYAGLQNGSTNWTENSLLLPSMGAHSGSDYEMTELHGILCPVGQACTFHKQKQLKAFSRRGEKSSSLTFIAPSGDF